MNEISPAGPIDQVILLLLAPNQKYLEDSMMIELKKGSRFPYRKKYTLALQSGLKPEISNN